LPSHVLKKKEKRKKFKNFQHPNKSKLIPYGGINTFWTFPDFFICRRRRQKAEGWFEIESEHSGSRPPWWWV